MRNKNHDSHQNTSTVRRKLIQLIGLSPLALQAAPMLMSPVFAQSAKLSVQALSNSLSLISGSGCNVLVKRSNDGDILVVDGGLEGHAGQLLDAIAEASGSASSGSLNIATLINTHWHQQQTGLNAILGQQGATIFSHVNTQQWLSAEINRPWEEAALAPLPSVARPNKVFHHYGDLQHGNSTVQYGYMRQAHTDGDMYVYFPEDNVLHGGGVISNEGWPLMDWWTGGWIGGLVDGLETLLSVANDDTVIVPANGPVMTKAELQAMRDMYETVFGRVRGLFMSANSPQETIDAKPAAEYAGRWGNPDQFVLMSHQSLIPHYTPDA